MRFVGCFKTKTTFRGEPAKVPAETFHQGYMSVQAARWMTFGASTVKNGGVEDDEQNTEIYPGKNINTPAKFNIAY